MIRALAGSGVRGWRYEGYTGVWVGEPTDPRKIAAIGVKVSSRGISSHGFALNVDPELAHFDGIIPCGIDAHSVTSVVKTTGHSLTVTDFLTPVTSAFARVFGLEAERDPLASTAGLLLD